jgi:hypothetical protein
MGKNSLLFLTPFFLLSFFLNAQEVLDCDSIYARYDSLSKQRIGPFVYEKAPEFKRQLNLYLDSTEIIPSGKIIARIIINQQGRTECVRILRSDREELNIRAISLLQTLTFAPAELRGRAKNAELVLPVYFGKKELLKGKAMKRKKN